MDFDLEKIGIKNAAMKAADKSLLLATGSKFGRRALAEICEVDAFAEVVSEA